MPDPLPLPEEGLASRSAADPATPVGTASLLSTPQIEALASPTFHRTYWTKVEQQLVARTALAALAERDAARQEIERHVRDNERLQGFLAKSEGRKMIDLLQQVDDWMQVCHQQESEIERVEGERDAALSCVRRFQDRWRMGDGYAVRDCWLRGTIVDGSLECEPMTEAEQAILGRNDG